MAFPLVLLSCAGRGVDSRRGSWQGITRIRCPNPDCHFEYLRPFSWRGFHLCPSCSKKRALLITENYSTACGKSITGAAVVAFQPFGEAIEEDAEHRGAPHRLLHDPSHLFDVKAAYEVTEPVRGRDEAMIWGWAGWIGCQRNPIHWGGRRLHLGRPRHLDPWLAAPESFGLRLLEP